MKKLRIANTMLLALVIIMMIISLALADTKISELPASTGITSDDLLIIVNDPSGTPVTQKITWGDIIKAVGAMGATTPAAGTFTTVTANSLTLNKSSGVPGKNCMYEANSTDTDCAGFAGAATMSDNTSYLARMPSARTTSANMVQSCTNAGESGTGTPADPYIQTCDWYDLDGKQDAITRPVTAPTTPTANGLVKFTGTGYATDNAGLILGTLTNGYYCTYASSGTLLNCNTQYPTASALSAQYIDWNQASGATSIANKPTLGTMAAETATNYVPKSLFDAYTILYATTDNTPAALTVTEQTVVGRVTSGAIAALTIDSDLSSVSASDDTIPSAKATKAALDNKQATITRPVTAPTTPTANGLVKFTGTGYATDNAGLILGTLTNGYYCTYASSGTLLNCNTQYPTASALSAQYIDWNQASGATSIANKPTIGTLAALVSGTLTNTYLCKYTSAGTLIDCNVDPATFQPALTSSSTPIVSTFDVGNTDTTITRSAAGVIAVEGVVSTRTIASGATTSDQGSISSGACSAAIDGGTATGVATTDVIVWNFNGDPTGITGFAPLATGGLYIVAYPTTDHVNFKICNNTGAAIDPGAITLNWKVVR